MSNQDVQELDYQTVRQRVVRRVIKRALFGANLVLWVIALTHDNPASARDDGVLVLWMMLLIVHFVYAFEIWNRIVDRMTQREIENLQRKGYRVASPVYPVDKKAAVKAKRESIARQADDGEIVYEEEPPRASARRNR